MSKKLFLKSLVFLAIVSSGLSCQAVTEESIDKIRKSITSTSQTNLNNPLQPFAELTTTGKFPCLIVGLPGRNEMRTFDFGTVKASGKIRYIEDLQDYERMIPIKALWHYGNPNLYREEKYLGWSDKPLEMATEDLLRTYCILNTQPSDKNVLVDIYVKNYPIKMVFKKAGEFKAFKDYLIKAFTKNNVEIAEQKPKLLIQFEDGGFGLGKKDYDFLDKFYDVVDCSDGQALAFFGNADKYKSQMTSVFREKSIQVGKTFGQVTMDTIESTTKKFGGLKWESVIGALVIGSLGTWAISKAYKGSGLPGYINKGGEKIEGCFQVKTGEQKPVKKDGVVVKDENGNAKMEDIMAPNYKVIFSVLAGIVGSYVAMKLVKKMLDGNKLSEKILKELEEEIELLEGKEFSEKEEELKKETA